MGRFSITSSKKILGIIFLSLALVAATYVVTSGKFNMNPNKSASVCANDCSTDSDCASGQYCSIRSVYGETCGECKVKPSPTSAPSCQYSCKDPVNGACPTGFNKVDGSCPRGVCCKPTSTPTPTPKTPTPTSCSSDKRCTSSQKGYKRCDGDSLLEKCDGKCWQVEEVCGGHTGQEACYSYNNDAQCSFLEKYLITSGTCDQKCLSEDGVCIGLGTNEPATNSKIMSWGDWTSCTPRTGRCTSTIKRLESGKYCLGRLPEWTYCSCVINPFAGK